MFKTNCLFCNIESNKKFSHKFCTKQCSALYHNRRRRTLGLRRKNTFKLANCIFCNKQLKIHNNASKKKSACFECSKKHFYIKTEYKICPHCKQNKIINKNTMYCSKSCLNESQREARSKGGRNSAFIQGNSRRSQNEILFANLCALEYLNVLINKPIFNGWDADIILPDLKIAVLWNGIWHYKQITQKHSVSQVQNRDSIKIKEIMNLGYKPYVIRDVGRKNPTFVKNQFDLFKKWCLEQNSHLHPAAYETAATTN